VGFPGLKVGQMSLYFSFLTIGGVGYKSLRNTIIPEFNRPLTGTVFFLPFLLSQSGLIK
jgi:hypothetical protein